MPDVQRRATRAQHDPTTSAPCPPRPYPPYLMCSVVRPCAKQQQPYLLCPLPPALCPPRLMCCVVPLVRNTALPSLPPAPFHLPSTPPPCLMCSIVPPAPPLPPLPDVQRCTTRVGERLEEVFNQLRVKRADALGRDGQVEGEAGPATQVQHHVRQRLVQRGRELAKAMDAFAIAQSLQ